MVVFVNNQRLTSFEMTWNPQRVGAYELHVPATLIKPGMNRMTFISANGSRFKLWYLRVRPESHGKIGSSPRRLRAVSL
jgi:hypothetical protein